MKRSISLALLIATTLLISACATVTKETCNEIDWYQMGYDFGFDGGHNGDISTSFSSFQYYDTRCSELGMKGDLEAFEKGKKDGLARFCTSDRASRHGAKLIDPSSYCKNNFPEYMGFYIQGVKSQKDGLKSEFSNLTRSEFNISSWARDAKTPEEKAKVEKAKSENREAMRKFEAKKRRIDELLNTYQK